MLSPFPGPTAAFHRSRPPPPPPPEFPPNLEHRAAHGLPKGTCPHFGPLPLSFVAGFPADIVWGPFTIPRGEIQGNFHTETIVLSLDGRPPRTASPSFSGAALSECACPPRFLHKRHTLALGLLHCASVCP